MNKERRHYEESASVASSPGELFNYADDHSHFSAHMNKTSWMMAGGKMQTETDEGKGQKVGSHISMSGKVLGVNLFLDEVVIKHEPPKLKVWETVGSPQLLVIGPYEMGLEIKPEDGKSRLKVYIDYELPHGVKTHWLGRLFGNMYAKWCVRQMVKGTETHFSNRR